MIEDRRPDRRRQPGRAFRRDVPRLARRADPVGRAPPRHRHPSARRAFSSAHTGGASLGRARRPGAGGVGGAVRSGRRHQRRRVARRQGDRDLYRQPQRGRGRDQPVDPAVHDPAKPRAAHSRRAPKSSARRCATPPSWCRSSRTPDGVTGFIRNVVTGETDTVRAKYMIAADGNRSPIREQLGIGTRGHGLLADCVTIYFHADCGAALRGRNLGVIYVFNPDLRGFFRLVRTGDFRLPRGHDARRHVAARCARTSREGIDKERCIAFVRVGDRHAGRQGRDRGHRAPGARSPKSPSDSAKAASSWSATPRTSCRRWAASAAIPAFRTRTISPGSSRWCSRASPDRELLATYNTERQPIGELAIQQAYTRYVLRVVPERGKEGMQPIVDDLSMEIGYRYHSPAIISEPGSGAALYEDPQQVQGDAGHTRAARGARARGQAHLDARSVHPEFLRCWPPPAAAPGAMPPAPRQPNLGSRSMRTDLDRDGDIADPERTIGRGLWPVAVRRRHRSARRLCRLARQGRRRRQQGDDGERPVVAAVPKSNGDPRRTRRVTSR